MEAVYDIKGMQKLQQKLSLASPQTVNTIALISAQEQDNYVAMDTTMVTGLAISPIFCERYQEAP